MGDDFLDFYGLFTADISLVIGFCLLVVSNILKQSLLGFLERKQFINILKLG